MPNLYRPFRKIPTTDQHLSLVQDNLVNSLGSLEFCPMLGVRVAFGVQLAMGLNRISHGLGHAYRSWWAGNYDTTIILRPLSDPTFNPDKTKYLTIQASGPVVADLFLM